MKNEFTLILSIVALIVSIIALCIVIGKKISNVENKNKCTWNLPGRGGVVEIKDSIDKMKITWDSVKVGGHVNFTK